MKDIKIVIASITNMITTKVVNRLLHRAKSIIFSYLDILVDSFINQYDSPTISELISSAADIENALANAINAKVLFLKEGILRLNNY